MDQAADEGMMDEQWLREWAADEVEHPPKNLREQVGELLAKLDTARTNENELGQLRLLVGAMISDDGRDHARLFALEEVAEAARGAIVEPPGTDWWFRTRDAITALDALPTPAEFLFDRNAERG